MRSVRRRRAQRWLMAAATGVVLGLLISPAILCENALHIQSRFRLTPNAGLAASMAWDAGATWEAVEIAAADGVVLRAWWFLPAKLDAAGVIALHGVADARQGMAAHIRMLLRHDFAVLAPDSRGHGVSGGDSISYGIRETGDIQRWVEWMSGPRHVRQVYGIGQSMGGSILLQSLPFERQFRAVVADCPFASFEEISYDRLRQLAGLPRPAAWFLIQPAFLYARFYRGLDLRSVAPMDAIRSTHVPILLIHGADDTNVAPRHSRLIHEKNPATVLWEVPGAGHVASISTQPREYEAKVVDWFRTHP